MTGEFKVFADRVNQRVDALAKEYPDFYKVDITGDALWEHYLAAFPEGTNKIFRVRREFDCQCCKQFIKNLGNVVALDREGGTHTIWEPYADLPYPFSEVAAALHLAVVSRNITGVYRTRMRSFGAEHNWDTHSERRWDHFWASTPHKCISPSPGADAGAAHDLAQVLQRGLLEISSSAVATVLGLIENNALYRGAQYKTSVVGFKALQRSHPANEIGSAAGIHEWCWAHCGDVGAGIRNTAIGQLLLSLSQEGAQLESCVRSYERMVDPTSFQRTTTDIRPSMVRTAMKIVESLELMESLKRRHARLSDISVNDTVWVDNQVAPQLQGGTSELTAALMGRTTTGHGNLRASAVNIDLDQLINEVLPEASKLELLVDPEHSPNFMSITAPVVASAPSLFKWSNGFSWSYDGDTADSIKERVKRAGGNVDNALLRISLSWFNRDDLDIHADTPHGHVSFQHRAGVLDVDMNIQGETRTPVENLSWSAARLIQGDYKVFVHQYRKRESLDVGFDIEFALRDIRDKTFTKRYRRAVANNEQIDVCAFRVAYLGRDKVVSHLSWGAGMEDSEAGGSSKWGVRLGELVPVSAVLHSPNHWGADATGAKHTFFILQGACNPDPVRSIYNEYLRRELYEHRKVFEAIGDMSKAPFDKDQLSGVGFTAARDHRVVVVATTTNGKVPYCVRF